MKMLREYPAKIMLVGEYAVILGGSALTIPFPGFRAIIRSVKDIPPGKEKQAEQSLEYLKLIYDYIRNIPADSFHASPDLEGLAENLHSTWLDLDIPIGFGLGSSGTVSAAIYDLYFPGVDTLSLQQKKEDLALIESFFHGKSSGVDALSCHAGVPLRFRGSGSIEKPDFNPARLPGDYRFFLLNSGERFETGPLVKHFLKQMEDPGFKQAMEEEYLPLNQLLLEALLGERDADPAMLVKMLSDFQLKHFRKMIPEKALDLWIEGLVSNEYYMKLNGSGGGMMLGITHESFRESLEDRWEKKLLWIGQD
jgi:mevalonate kinase